MKKGGKRLKLREFIAMKQIFLKGKKKKNNLNAEFVLSGENYITHNAHVLRRRTSTSQLQGSC